MASIQVIAMFTAMHAVSKAPQSPRLCLRVKCSSLQVFDFKWVLEVYKNSPKAL